MNYFPKEGFLSRLVHRDLGDWYQCFLWCSREYVFQFFIQAMSNTFDKATNAYILDLIFLVYGTIFLLGM